MNSLLHVEIESLEHSGLGLQVFLIYTTFVLICLFLPSIKRYFQGARNNSQSELQQGQQPPRPVDPQPREGEQPRAEEMVNKISITDQKLIKF